MGLGDSGRTLTARLGAMFVSRHLTQRDLSVDALRGLMILGMILVNHPPPTEAIYSPLVHAAWHGWTLADTIFPGFLFTVGVSARFSLGAATGLAPGEMAVLGRKVLRRFGMLMLINFCLINFPYYFAGTVVFTGTLARIAWCYLLVAAIHLRTGWRAQLVLLVLLLSVQWCIYALLPLPGAGPGLMTADDNAALHLDRLLLEPVFGSHPDGTEGVPVLVPLIGAISTTLIGLMAGHWITSKRDTARSVLGLLAAGIALVVCGQAWNALLPINKTLWTGSYSLFMTGLAALILALLYLVQATGPGRWFTKPLQIAGVNALFFYVLAQSLQRVLVFGRVHDESGHSQRLRYYIYEHYVSPLGSGKLASLIYAFVFLSVCYAAVLVLYRKRVFIKL